MGLVMAGITCNLDRIWGLGPWACLWGIIILIMLSWDTAPSVPLWGCHSLPRILDCVSGETMLAAVHIHLFLLYLLVHVMISHHDGLYLNREPKEAFLR